MKKYKKIRVTFEEKVLDKERKPIYATRKLSVGLVSCMLGFMMFMPTVKAVEEEPISTSQQAQDKNEVLNNEDDYVQEENEDITPLNDQTDSKVESEENLSDQNLDGQNKEEDIIKEEKADSNLENKVEELLTADEIQAIRDRANSLENDYFFNDKMVEELKAELRKAKADPSVNYEEAKARLIEEAIIKNTPTQKAPGEVRVVSVKKPTINPVLYDATSISGANLAKARVNKKIVIATVHVSLKDSSGTEKANLTVTPKSGTTWKVDLPEGVNVAKGDTVIVYQQIGEDKSPEVNANAQPSKASTVTLTMPSGEVWIEQTSSNIVNKDEKAEAVQMLKDANTEIAGDIKSVEFSIDSTDHAYYEVTYTDGSTSGKIEATNLKIKQVTETSRTPEIESITIVDNVIKGKLAGEGPFDGIKVQLVLNINKEKSGDFCTDKGCKIDKDSSDPIEVAVQKDGTFSFALEKGKTLDLDQIVGVFVKEPHKFISCSKTTVKPAIPEKTEVKDPRKLTADDKKAIDAAIRKAYTVNGESKLPNGTGDWDGVPAVIQIDDSGNVKIFSGNDVAGTWDPNNDYKFVPEKNEDGSYKLNDGAEAKITIQAKDLVKNIGPVAPTIEETDDKKQITVNPLSNPADTDIIEHTVTYTGTDDKEKKIIAKQDLENKTWTISEGSEFANIDTKTGLITIDKSKIKNETLVKAFVQDNGEYVDNSDKQNSKESELKVTKTKADQVTELGGLDPVEIRKWVGEDIDWSKGIKVKKDENKDSINKLLEGATITDATDKKRNTEKEGDFVGKVSLKFDDGSELIVDNQYLYVSNHVTSAKRDKTPSDALEVEFKLGEGTKVDNTSGGAIEGNKDNPVSYSKYKVKPGTNLKEYKLPSINTSVVDSINVTTQDTYTDPVWKDSKNGTNFVASSENNVFTSTATKTYKFTLVPNGGEGDDKVTIKKTGEKYKLPEKSTFNPPNENQEFSGWMIGDGPGINKPGDEVTVDGDKVIKAIWKPIEFKVTFQTEKGATGSMKDETVTKGSEFKIPAPTFTPDKNKEFAGWKIEGQDGLKKAGEKIDKISGNVTLIATWKDIKVTVKYDANGGSGSMDGAEIVKGSPYKLSANGFTAPTNKEFAGWKIGETEYEPNAEITVNEDTTVTAIWKDIKVTVKYDANGGSGSMDGAEIVKGSPYKLSANGFTAPTNKEFASWKIGETEYEPNAEITVNEDTTVTAIWKDIKVTVKYDANGGSGSMDGAEIVKGSPYKLSANRFTAPTNKEFAGWKIGETEYEPNAEITVNEDTTVTAIWKDIKVTVKYDANGGSGSMDGAEIVKGSPYKLSANRFTAPTNKEFAGWKIGETEYEPNAEITVNEDTTVTAIWKDIKVTVKYDANGGSGSMDGAEIVKGSPYKLSANGFTAPTNKEFAGWKIGETEYKPDAEITVNEDITVTAIWKDKTPETPPVENYTVSFKTETGATGTMPDETVPKGKYTLPDPAFTAEKGKEFAGWKVGDDTDLKTAGSEIDITGNVILTAVWKGDEPETPPATETFKVSYDANGGSGIMTGAELKKGSTYKLLANGFTAPENKEFDIWEVNGEKLSPNSEITVDKDTVITAIWKDKTPEAPPVTEKVKVIYEGNGGSGSMEGKELNKGSKYILLTNGFEAPDKKKFKGWKIGNTEYAAGDEITVDKDTTVTAVWEDIETTPPVKEDVQVSYEPGEGSGTMDGTKLEKGSKYILSANGFEAPDKKKFKGWKIGDTEYAVGDEITVDKDTTVTAVWEDIETTPPAKEEVQVSYEPGEGSGTMDVAKLEKGSKYILSSNGFKAPANKKFKAWKIGDKEYAAGDEITVDKDTTVTAVWENVTTDPGKPDEGGNPDNPGTDPDQGGDNPNPGTNPDQGGDNPKPGTTPDQGVDKPNPGTTPDQGGDNPNPGTNPDQGGDKPNPGKPGEVGDSENPDKKPEDGKDKPNPGATPGKDSESPRPGTKPSDGENKAKATDKDNSKKTEGNKENPLDNTKVKVPRTNKVKENVQTGVEPIGQIGGILSAAIAGLFAIKKRKK
ncbi:Listeria-Bacteroides repeat domain (List_Bact_rpt) [Anaerococcus prevotii]|uniref:YSIRK Gram-positive signal peptide n=1 Tax=Anaerococcus prevotii (strain ATCC 9321 / DSM 20548 / JCM 6508 / NCTC 11806 / PC1) TaxID=525919 RepID=C7RH06_ANAPD|nr:InlB B-repeat-containing protein [Anaerococcus prevotii]ACV28767.1 YSIRK Gram-positive signal peptide [Anaerococcus prevotii DSM 20548]SUU94442.1 Listeria-Bacteroides repeat domain (List_Bact_rpt) [Anaerococcus prevotii]